MGRISVIAGQGPHPLELAQALAEQGQNPFVITLAGQSDADFQMFEVSEFPIGQVGNMVSAMKSAGCDRVVMAGKVVRPPLSLLKPDAIAIKLLGSLFLAGDNAILEALKTHLNKEGLVVEDAETYLPRSTLPKHYLFGGPVTPENRRDIEIGIHALAKMDGLDIGQGLVIQGARILSVEAAEGTDALLARTAPFVDKDLSGAVFVKMSKLSQDKTQDAPSFGVETLRHMASAGIYIGAFEAEYCRARESLEEIEAEAKLQNITLVSVQYEPVS